MLVVEAFVVVEAGAVSCHLIGLMDTAPPGSKSGANGHWVPWELGRSRNLHPTMAGWCKPGSPSTRPVVGVATGHHRSNETPAQPAWYCRAKETVPAGRIVGSLSLFIVPMESRVTNPRGAGE